MLADIVHRVSSGNSSGLIEHDDVLGSKLLPVQLSSIIFVVDDEIDLPGILLPLQGVCGHYVVGSPVGQDEHSKIITQHGSLLHQLGNLA